MKNLLPILLLTFMYTGCSSEDVQDEDFVDDGSVVEAEEKELNNLYSDKAEEKQVAAEAVIAQEEEKIAEAPKPVIAPVVAYSAATSGNYDYYVAEEKDTLMLVAFKIYGDYHQWKELKKLNPDLKHNSIQAGDKIKYRVPAERFTWSPKGNPYLIQNGQTLGLISKDVYGMMKRWREIYENNRPMIKDPNLIFAGFTLYYIPDENRLPASSKK